MNLYILIVLTVFMIDVAVFFAIRHEKSITAHDAKREQLLKQLFTAMKQNPVRGVL